MLEGLVSPRVAKITGLMESAREEAVFTKRKLLVLVFFLLLAAAVLAAAFATGFESGLHAEDFNPPGAQVRFDPKPVEVTALNLDGTDGRDGMTVVRVWAGPTSKVPAQISELTELAVNDSGYRRQSDYQFEMGDFSSAPNETADTPYVLVTRVSYTTKLFWFFRWPRQDTFRGRVPAESTHGTANVILE